jgi:hypothetical protein
MNNLNKIIDILKLIDTPKKLVVLIILITFLIFAHTTWENRFRITDKLVQSFGSLHIDEKKIDLEAKGLLKELNAESVSVWSVNPEKNIRTLLYRSTKNGIDSSSIGMSNVLFRVKSDSINPVVNLINSRSVCLPASDEEELKPMAGVTFACIVAIPPAYVDGFIGILIVGFKTTPTHQDHIILRMKQTSYSLTK